MNWLKETTALVTIAIRGAFVGTKQTSRKVRVEKRGNDIVCLPPLPLPSDRDYSEGGTITGRFSNNDPEQQYIREVKKSRNFAADYGMGEAKLSDYSREVASGDYSEIERRVMAHYADDKDTA